MADQKNKPWLMFLIDEGFKWDIIGRAKYDYNEMDRYLDNICEALDGFEARFRPAVLLYPNQFYDRDAYGKENPEDIDRVHPALRHLLAYFERRIEKGLSPICVFIEIYSSGITTGQNGELGELQPPPLYFNKDTEERIGLSMDMEAFSALKKNYDKAFAGVRFHEVYGSDLVIKVTSKHGYYIEADVIRGIIDMCAENNLVLYWSDSNWMASAEYQNGLTFVNDKYYKAYMDAEPYVGLQDYAVAKMGENIIFSYANNNFSLPNNLERIGEKAGPTKQSELKQLEIGGMAKGSTYQGALTLYDYLYFDLPWDIHPLRERYPNNWAVSDQSWFWSEAIHVLGYKQYYAHSHDDCPIELIAAFCEKAIKDGTRGIQFEPNYYLFNTGTQTKNSPAGHEGMIDCSARTNLIRLKAMLLNKENLVSEVPNEFFDEDMQSLLEYDAANPPKCYTQSTLHAFGDIGYPAAYCYDFYNNQKPWIANQPYRIPKSIAKNKYAFSARAALNASGDDMLLLAQSQQESEGEKLKLNVIRTNGAPAGINFNVLNQAGKDLICMTAANINPNTPADELILVFKDNENKLELLSYAMTWHPGKGGEEGVIFTPYIDGTVTQMQSWLEKQNIDSFGGIASLRGNYIVYEDGTRLCDMICLITKAAGKLNIDLLNCKLNSAEIKLCGMVNGPSGLPIAIGIDMNTDRTDEFLCLTKEGRDYIWHCYALTPNGFELIERRRDGSAYNYMRPLCAAGTQKTILLKAVKNPKSSFPVRNDALV